MERESPLHVSTEDGTFDTVFIEEIYGIHYKELMDLMVLKANDLKGDTFRTYEHVVANHIDRVTNYRPSWLLKSLGEKMQWLNTTRPLSVDKDLKNRLLVIDFFTYCCINCINILPILKEIETEYKQNPGVVVIGVHSPKFSNEKDIRRVHEALVLNGIEHPVINDPDNVLWKKFGVHCWPTVFVIGPSHHLLFILVGESQIDKLPFLCHCILAKYRDKKWKLNAEDLPVKPNEVTQKSTLLFPHGVSTNDKSVLVSDTGHHRLLLLSNLGKVKEVIGSGIPGLNDGSFENASFYFPSGTAWANNSIIYVADRKNHLIRLINLEKRSVSTVKMRKPEAQNKIVHPDDPLPKSCDTIPNTMLQSPWDVCIGPELGMDLDVSNTLYVAAAGSHQIWSVSLDIYGYPRGRCSPFAGNGQEGKRDNSYKYLASFAQPSGITYSRLCPGYLYIADSESSAIRSICLKTGAVRTVIGGGSNPTDLFKYGDQDGVGVIVLIQHPLGIDAFTKNHLIFTDAYNHKVKLLDVLKKECTTIAGGSDQFCEPSGLCVTENQTFLVCDTNNHSIKVINSKLGSVAPMPVICDLSNQMGFVTLYNREDPSHGTITSDVLLEINGEINLYFEIIGSRNITVNEEEMQTYEIDVSGLDKVRVIWRSNKLFTKSKPTLEEPSLTLKCGSSSSKSTQGSVMLIVTLFLCDHSSNTCFTKKISFEFAVKLLELGKKQAYVRLCCILN